MSPKCFSISELTIAAFPCQYRSNCKKFHKSDKILHVINPYFLDIKWRVIHPLSSEEARNLCVLSFRSTYYFIVNIIDLFLSKDSIGVLVLTIQPPAHSTDIHSTSTCHALSQFDIARTSPSIPVLPSSLAVPSGTFPPRYRIPTPTKISRHCTSVVHAWHNQ